MSNAFQDPATRLQMTVWHWLSLLLALLLGLVCAVWIFGPG